MNIPADLWEEILEFIQNQVDVKDGEDGPQPNKAMSLYSRIEREVQP